MRIVRRWRFEQGVAFRFRLPVYDEYDGSPFNSWDGHRVQLDLADEYGAVVVSFDSDGGTAGTVDFRPGELLFRLSAAAASAMEATTTRGRGKDKAQLTGRLVATFPIAPDAPEYMETIKAVVAEA